MFNVRAKGAGRNSWPPRLKLNANGTDLDLTGRFDS